MLNEFTPLESTLGGLLLGLSAAAVLLVHGRMAGISGIVSGLRAARGDDLAWRALFLCGLLAGGAAHFALLPRAELPTPPALGPGRYALAGALVGVGTHLGSGCTSGHGICGLARGSLRSLAAVLTFVAAGMATTAALPLPSRRRAARRVAWVVPMRAYVAPHAPVAALAAVAGLLALSARVGRVRLNALLCGVSFGFGLAVSGMCHPLKVAAFLDITARRGAWDPSLACVMGGGLAGAALGVRAARRMATPLLAPRFDVPTRLDVDARLLLGSALFGVGWALAGACPGPALVDLCLLFFGIDVSRSLGVFVAAMVAAMAAVDVALPVRPPAAAPAKKTADKKAA